MAIESTGTLASVPVPAAFADDYMAKRCAQQYNSDDCGVFVCLFARTYLIKEDVLVNPSTVSMPINFRAHMSLEIKEDTLMPLTGDSDVF